MPLRTIRPMPGNGLRSFGTLADRYSRSFSSNDPFVVFDDGGAAEALRECATRRFNGETFFVRPILQDDATVRADAVASSIFATFHTLDEQRIALEQASTGSLQVSGRALSEVSVYKPEPLRLMQAALRLADGVVCSSEAERSRIRRVLQTDQPCAIWPLMDPSVPVGDGAARTKDAIVIWGPQMSGDAGAAFAAALGDLRIPLLLVTGSSPSASTSAAWVSPAEGQSALARAKLIIDTAAHGCDQIRALATWKTPIVADAASGAQELGRGIRSYERQRFVSLLEATLAALGGPASEIQEPASALGFDVRPELADGPLVSIVIPTFDRPVLLALALESIRRQTYKNIETIVVVDGGPRLDDLAKRFSEVRFIHMAENNPLVSSNTAFAAAKGEYIAFLNDDDVFFPNHISALATALERSGEAVAHGDVLTAFLRGSDQEWLTYGFESNMSRAVDLPAILVSNQIGMTSAMFRRACIKGDEAFEEAVPLYRDYALWLRLASQFDFVHVERITSCYTIRNGGTQQQSTVYYDKALRSYEAVYDAHPATGRPVIRARREQVLDSVRAGRMGIVDAQPAGEIAPAPWPLWSTREP